MSGRKHQGGERYELVIEATPDDHAPPIIRLRHVLKGLIRQYNFRAVSVRDVTPKLAPLPPTVALEATSGTGATGPGRPRAKSRCRRSWRYNRGVG